jgi:hypothetical protein
LLEELLHNVGDMPSNVVGSADDRLYDKLHHSDDGRRLELRPRIFPFVVAQKAKKERIQMKQVWEIGT